MNSLSFDVKFLFCFFSRRKFGKSCLNFSQMVSSWSFSRTKKRETAVKKSRRVPSPRWRLSKDWRQVRSAAQLSGTSPSKRAFSEEPIGVRPGRRLLSVSSGRKKRDAWKKEGVQFPACSSQETHPRVPPQATFCLFFLFL